MFELHLVGRRSIAAHGVRNSLVYERGVRMCPLTVL